MSTASHLHLLNTPKKSDFNYQANNSEEESNLWNEKKGSNDSLVLTVNPERFCLPFTYRAKATLVLENNNNCTVCFIISTNSPETLEIEPRSGCLAPREKASITIKRPKRAQVAYNNEHLIFKIKYCNICNSSEKYIDDTDYNRTRKEKILLQKQKNQGYRISCNKLDNQNLKHFKRFRLKSNESYEIINRNEIALKVSPKKGYLTTHQRLLDQCDELSAYCSQYEDDNSFSGNKGFEKSKHQPMEEYVGEKSRNSCLNDEQSRLETCNRESRCRCKTSRNYEHCCGFKTRCNCDSCSLFQSRCKCKDCMLYRCKAQYNCKCETCQLEDQSPKRNVEDDKDYSSKIRKRMKVDEDKEFYDDETGNMLKSHKDNCKCSHFPEKDQKTKMVDISKKIKMKHADSPLSFIKKVTTVRIPYNSIYFYSGIVFLMLVLVIAISVIVLCRKKEIPPPVTSYTNTCLPIVKIFRLAVQR